MRLAELTYKNYKKDLAPKDQINHCRKYYLDYFQKCEEPVIWRGSDSELSGITKVNPKALGRASAHTSNEYTVLMSNLPEWSAFPKRSESLICSYDRGFASGYGEQYGVILPNSFRLGVASREDIWLSFPVLNKKFKFEYGLSQLNDCIGQIMGRSAGAKTTLEELKKSLADLQAKVIDAKKNMSIKLMEWSHNALAIYVYTNIPEGSPADTLFETIRKCMDPAANRFTLITSVQDLPSIDDAEDNEVWTDSNLLLVDGDSYGILRDQVLGR